MKKSLMIMLLIIVSSIKCTFMAQEINRDDKLKIVDYINCFYTAKYVLSELAKTTEAEKQVIKEAGIDTVSIGYAYKYAELDSILKNNNLKVTADNLTMKLNKRNGKIADSANIFIFFDNVVDTKDFENFNFTRQDECTARNAILRWYIDKNIHQEENKSENRDAAQPKKESKKLPDWGWIPLVILLVNIIITVKSRGNDDFEKHQSPSSSSLLKENDKLKEEIKKLKEKLEEKGGKSEETVRKMQNEINNEVRRETEAYLHKDIEKSTVAIVYYADIDVSNNIFVRNYKEETRISVYAINVSQQTFVPIENKQLYDKLSMVNSSGILDACEVRGNYQSGKAICITSGKVQQEKNGKWRIINKAIIEIK